MDVRVRILSRSTEFDQKIGTIIAREDQGGMIMYRIRLDEPVHVKSVGLVTDDLWSPKYFELLEYEEEEEEEEEEIDDAGDWENGEDQVEEVLEQFEDHLKEQQR